MKCLLVIILVVLCMAGTVLASSDSLSSVSFTFDNIPCGKGILINTGAPSVTIETKSNGVPVTAYVYFKDGKSIIDTERSPLDWFAVLSYYKEKFYNIFKYTLVGYTRRFYLGDSETDINTNYNKLYADLKQVLGDEELFSLTKGTPDLQKISAWNKNGIGISLSLIKIKDINFASVETVCRNELSEALSKEDANKKQKYNTNMFK